MRINTSLATGSGLARHREHPMAQEAAVEPVRAALPALIEPRPAGGVVDTLHPRAQALPGLVAQLIAHAEDMPASRARRRTDPASGSGAYELVARLSEHPHPHSGRVI